MAGQLTKGFKLAHKSGASASTYTNLANCISWPDFGGSKDTIEITTLDSSAHEYMGGLDNYGDDLAFEFLHDKTQFTTLNGLSGTIYWQASFPDGSKATFTGECYVTMNGKTYNEGMTYTLHVMPNSAITWA